MKRVFEKLRTLIELREAALTGHKVEARNGEQWVQFNMDNLINRDVENYLSGLLRLRLAPDTMVIRGHKMNKGRNTEPKEYQMVYVPSLVSTDKCTVLHWKGDNTRHSDLLHAGLVYDCPEDAVAVTQALMGRLP